MSNKLLQTFILVCSTVLLRAQAPASLKDSCFLSFPAFFMKTAAKADHLGERLGGEMEKIMQYVKKRESRIQKKMQNDDAEKAKELLLNAEQKYRELEERLRSKTLLKRYIPVLDTLLTTLKFLDTPRQSAAAAPNEHEINIVLGKLNDLQDKFGKADVIQSFLEERRQFLEGRINQPCFAKDIKKISKQVYYFGEKLNECRVALDDPGRAIRKVIKLISESKVFRDFLRKNSLLASLFPIPYATGDPLQGTNFTGLQTREQLNSIIRQQLPDANARDLFHHNLQEAQTQLDKWKVKILECRKNNSNDLVPGNFKPNNQKTKSFFQRIEIGINVQTQKARGFLPVASDFGLSFGYKLNDRSVVGIGTSYKLGLGRNWNHLRITCEGMGLRSFIDGQLKGNLWLTAGYEMNHQAFFDGSKNISAWRQSGLVGISKLIVGRNKILKKTKLQFLWDFLSYQRQPRSQPLLMRAAYNLN
jgi:hypothetical protein